MCGRATLSTGPEDLAETFDLAEVPVLSAHYNIAPSQGMAVVRRVSAGEGAGAARRLDLLRWGLVPWWAEDPSIGNRFINARSETLLGSRAFGESARQRRCLVVIDGFYEWQRQGKKKQPFFIHRADGKPFALAGLWERWRAKGAPKDTPRLETCTVITTTPTTLLARVHDRMPLVLAPSEWDAWLDPSRATDEAIAPLLVHQQVEGIELELYPVSERVGSPANDDAHLIERIPEPTLFPL